MSYDQFKTLTLHPAPGFVCKPAGRGRESERFTARLTHELREPASPADLERLRQIVPAGAEQLLAFYALHNGFVLYRDTLTLAMGSYLIQAAGVELFRVADMERKTASLYKSLEMIDDEDDPNSLKTSVAIGESPHSGNYFAVTVDGPQTGKVFFVDHDDWQEKPFADSFDEFLARICTSPATLLSKTLGCTARYSDGKTATQWIPVEYVANALEGV